MVVLGFRNIEVVLLRTFMFCNKTLLLLAGGRRRGGVLLLVS